MTTSYIVFDGAPTVAECHASWDYAPSTSDWVTTVSPCYPSGSTPSPPLSPANTSARYADASSTETSGAPDEELEGTDLYANNVVGDASLLEPNETASRMEDDSEDYLDAEDDSQLWTGDPICSLKRGGEELTTASGTLSVVGPSGYPLLSHQQSQFCQTQLNEGGSLYGEMSYADEEASYIGAPPNYEWKTSQLTELSKLRSVAEGRSMYGRRRASILAVIRSFEQPKEIKAGLWLAKWCLEDASGGALTLVIWGETAKDWSEAVQVGDVVFIGGEYPCCGGGHAWRLMSGRATDINLKLHEGIVEGTPSTSDSALQICYRTRKFKEEDEGYRFRPEHAECSAQAEKVLSVVKWYGNAYPP